jgi:hypothetical protein
MVAVILVFVADDLGRQIGQTSFWDFLIRCLVTVAT